MTSRPALAPIDRYGEAGFGHVDGLASRGGARSAADQPDRIGGTPALWNRSFAARHWISARRKDDEFGYGLIQPRTASGRGIGK